MYLINLYKNQDQSLEKYKHSSFNFKNGNLSIQKNLNNSYQIKETSDHICLLDGFFYGFNILDVPLGAPEIMKNFLKRVDGFFLLIVIEKNTGIVHAFSDHIGSKTLYYLNNRGHLAICNREEQLCKHSTGINKKKVQDYFSFSVDDGKETFFDSIYKLEPRSYIRFSNFTEIHENYFKFKTHQSSQLTKEADLIEAYREIFLKSLKFCADQCPDNIGSALSGGLDSSSITAGLNKVTSKTIIAQTVCFNGLKEAQDKKANEMEYALELTKSQNILHDSIILKNTGCISDFENTTSNFVEPNGLVNGYIHRAIFENLQKRNINSFFDGFAGDSVINHGYLYLNTLAKRLQISKLIKEDRLIHQKRGAIKYFSSIRTLKRVLIPTLVHPRILWHLNPLRKGENRFNLWGKRINPKLRQGSIYNNLKKFYGYNPLEISKDTQNAHLKSILSPQITASVRNAQKMADGYGVDMYFHSYLKSLLSYQLIRPLK